MTEGIGWLPVEARDALEEERDWTSHDEAEALLAMPPRQRVLALLDRASCRAGDSPPGVSLRPADLERVLASFAGEALPAAAELAARYPAIVEPPG